MTGKEEDMDRGRERVGTRIIYERKKREIEGEERKAGKKKEVRMTGKQGEIRKRKRRKKKTAWGRK